MSTASPTSIVIVSDGTGDTAKKVLDAALHQFDDLTPTLAYARHIADVSALSSAFVRAKDRDALVLSTLVSPHLRQEAARLALLHQVRHVDLLGDILDALTRSLNRAPVGVPNLLHRTDEHYFRRVDAIEFTVASDDGRDPARLRTADLVLVGASRTGKTPLSTFLAHRGLRVANQPLWLAREVPTALFEIDPARVVGLTIDPHNLLAIRASRLRAQHVGTEGQYVDPDAIRAELEHIEALCRGNGWMLIDVTHRAIEETAAIVIQHLQDAGAMNALEHLIGP